MWRGKNGIPAVREKTLWSLTMAIATSYQIREKQARSGGTT
jgi:hypothetical protein